MTLGGSGSAAASDAGHVEGASRGRQSQNGGRMPTPSPPPPPRRCLRIPHHPSQLSQRRVSGLAEEEEEEEEEGERQRTLLSLTYHFTLLSPIHKLKLD